MKRMLLTVELVADENNEIDFETLDDVLEGQGFYSAVENEEGTRTMLPLGSFYGEFDDGTSASSLVDKVEQALGDSDFDMISLLISEMGGDMVLIGEEEVDEEEIEPEAKA